MFTGIIEEVGRVVAIERHSGFARLYIACDRVVADAEVGDSIAVSGCCLTVTTLAGAEADPGGRAAGWVAGADPQVAEAGGTGVSFDMASTGGFTADLMAETMAATSLGGLAEGDPVNLERAMRADDRLGGHLVQGHVDGVGEVIGREEQPGTVWLSIAAPGALGRYLVPKGSVTVDGVSLTVVDVREEADDVVFRIALIPHTLEVTTFGPRAAGDRVNLEVDVIAKYVERLLAAGAETPYDAQDRPQPDGHAADTAS